MTLVLFFIYAGSEFTNSVTFRGDDRVSECKKWIAEHEEDVIPRSVTEMIPYEDWSALTVDDLPKVCSLVGRIRKTEKDRAAMIRSKLMSREQRRRFRTDLRADRAALSKVTGIPVDDLFDL